MKRLPSGHELSEIRADDISSQATVYDHFEREVIKAAALEGARPSPENLPCDGTLISRVRSDDMGGKSIEFFGRESFIKDMSRPGRQVRCIRDARSGQAIWGSPLPQAR